VVIHVSYAALREATQERERQGVDQETADAIGGGRRRLWRKGSWNSVFDSSSRGFYIVGKGAPLTLHQAT
jgi:hypothetical protein